jgi:hypothetical protein
MARRGGTQGASSRINGGRNRLNEIQLDGITAVNIKAASATPMVDALQEFKILTNSFAAEYGRTGVVSFWRRSNPAPTIPRHYLQNFSVMTPLIRNFFARPQDKPVLKQINSAAFGDSSARIQPSFS